MNQPINLKTATLAVRNLIRPATAGCGFLLAAVALAWFALSSTARAADGDVGNGSTAEGTAALARLTSGSYNTAMGLQALFSNTTGNNNTATGTAALYSNTTAGGNTAIGFQALQNNNNTP
jgi:trimeric autotransporter adhesin